MSALRTHSRLLNMRVSPDGNWFCPLQKIGLRMILDARTGSVSWFGRGPGEAYRDTHRATRVGRFHATMEALSTPYVRPGTPRTWSPPLHRWP